MVRDVQTGGPNRRRGRGVTGALAAGALLLIAASWAGCGTSGASTGRGERGEDGGESVAPGAGGGAGRGVEAGGAAGVGGGGGVGAGWSELSRPRDGLELIAVPALDEQAVVARALAALEDEALEVDAAQRAVWSRAGMRVVAVPIEDVPRLRTFLTRHGQLGGVDQRAVAPGPVWTDARREGLGDGAGRERTIALHDARVTLRPGTLRLLVRVWPEPAVEGQNLRPVLVVELLPQLRDPRGSRTVMDLLDATQRREADAADPRVVEEQGLSFTRLRLRLRLPPGRAAAITYEEPGVRWPDAVKAHGEELAAQAAGAGGEGADEPPAPGQIRRTDRGTAGPGRPATPVVRSGERDATGAVHMGGPLVPAPLAAPTLGSALFTETGPMGPEGPRVRWVLIIEPTSGGRFELIPN